MKAEIRCCCNPGKLLGTVPVCDLTNQGPFEVTLPLNGGGTLTLPVGKLATFVGADPRVNPEDAVRVGSKLAIKSNDVPIEELRKIVGFEEA